MRVRTGAPARSWWTAAQDGLLAGALTAVTLVAGLKIADESDDALATGIGAGLAIAVLVVGASWAISVTDLELLNPRVAIERDRMAATLIVGTVTVLFVVLGATERYSPTVEVSIAVLGLLALLMRSRWPGYTLARAVLAGIGELPWRPARFLADAHRRGLLRRVAAVYQFRHARLQDHFAS